MTDPLNSRLGAARARWHSAEDRLYPTLVASPASYQRALAEIQAVLTELRRLGERPEVLLDTDTDPAGVLAAACPGGISLPADLLIGVACAARDRQLRAEADRRRVTDTIALARAQGRDWAVLSGPEQPEQLTDGEASVLHLPTATVLTATVDPWSGGPPFLLRVTPSEGEGTETGYPDRATWLAACRTQRAELSGAAPDPAGTP